MRFLIQRVTEASVSVDQQILGKIDKGFLVFIGISQTDTEQIADKMVKKLLGLRIFEDENGKTRDRLDVIRERHGLKPVVSLYINPKGLTYTELRAMLNLKSKSRKYSDLTTDQLTTLRDRVLFFFEEEVEKHIKQW